MLYSLSVPCVVLILAMSIIGLIQQSHQRALGHIRHTRASNQHHLLYLQINDDGYVDKSKHQNDYTLMDIAFTNNGILIKGRKSARYLCSYPNNTLYSMFQLTENCKFREGRVNDLLHDHRSTQRRNDCFQPGQVNSNSDDPLGMMGCS